MPNHGRAGRVARRILSILLPACCAAGPSVGGIELGNQIHSRAHARTLDALVDRTRPTFAWGDGDMLWVMSDVHGKPLFALNHAYQLDDPSRPGAWVLFDASASYVPNGLVEYTRQVTPGRVLAHDRQHGTVYLVSWNSRERTGTGIVGASRQILLWRDRAGDWKFVGEAPAILRGQSGPRTFTTSITYRVQWTAHASSSLEIHATRSENTDYSSGNEAVALHVCRDYLLDGNLPAEFVRVGADYIPTDRRMKLGNAIERVATCKTFYPQERDPGRKKKMLTAVSDAIAELNPHGARDRILLPDMDRIWDLAGRAAGPRGRHVMVTSVEDR